VSLDAVIVRMQELHQLLNPASATPATTAAPSTEFSAALSSATASSPVASAASAGDATGSLADVPYSAEITAAAQRHGLDPALLAGLIRQESGFDAGAVSPAGATGLTQLMPGTAAALGVTDASDPLQAIEGGAKYLAQQLETFGGDVAQALAAYNAGPGAVQRYGGVPPYAETQAYVQKVQGYAEQYRSTASTAATAAATATASSLAAPAGGLAYSTV
jgi:soluble lytic murein transglycosylase-like protein